MKFKFYFFLNFLLLNFGLSGDSFGQTSLTQPPSRQNALPGGINNAFNHDSTNVDSMKSDWVDEQAEIYATHLHSDIKLYPDTGIATFHRYQSHQPWWGTTLGNYGSAAKNAFFTPNHKIGIQLGYDIYDLYKFQFDSLKYYNTTRPYSAFSFLSGSQNQQNVEILHTQNITPSWNFAARLRSLSSEGFYAQQKANSISGSFSSNYASKNDRYKIYFGINYNKFNQDENGGIVTDSFLNLPNFGDRRRIPVNIPLSRESRGNKSAMKNTWQEFDFFVLNDYSWGRADTLYNEDSTSATYKFTPRFALQHELRIHSEKHIFEDDYPDSLRYDFISALTFNRPDSIYGVQNMLYVDNKFSLNGYLGKSNSFVHFKAGIGNRIDQFSESYIHDKNKMNSFGNYVFGTLKKEALEPKQWAYQAEAQFYFSGKAIGNFDFKASAGKDLGKWGLLAAGFSQSLSNPGLSYETFKTNYFIIENSFDKVSTTSFWGKVSIPEIKLEVGLNNYLINNYLYFGKDGFANQYTNPISILQIYGRKKFDFNNLFSLDNEIVWQQPTLNAPVNLPAFMIREQFKMETYIFNNALLAAVGIEARYLSPYYVDDYNPYFNKFYLQDNSKENNLPVLSAFFNFKIKSFRAFLLGDQLQQLFSKNIIYSKNYPYPNALFQFGFTWVLIN